MFIIIIIINRMGDRREKLREGILKRETGQTKRRNTQETEGTKQEKEYSRNGQVSGRQAN